MAADGFRIRLGAIRQARAGARRLIPGHTDPQRCQRRPPGQRLAINWPVPDPGFPRTARLTQPKRSQDRTALFLMALRVDAA